jgi:hypothetical protein
MFTFVLNRQMLSDSETALFSCYLQQCSVDDAIWSVYRCLPEISSRVTQPVLLRAYQGPALVGAALLVRCSGYGASLFKNAALRRLINWLRMPCYVWIRVGFCAETIANPGFVADGHASDAVIAAMIDYMRRRARLFVVIDEHAHGAFHQAARAFPYVNDGAIDVSRMHGVQDYLAEHRNIKRKIQEFRSKGGAIDVCTGPLDAGLSQKVRACLEATARRSLIRSPFQDTFVDCAVATGRCDSPRTVHFIARLQGEFVGYHSFLQTGDGLRMMHGAFDRERPTTHHAYENIIIDTVRHAIESGLKSVCFGPVMNETKRRMMNRFEEVDLYFYAKGSLAQMVFARVLPHTRLQSEELLVFGRRGDR